MVSFFLIVKKAEHEMDIKVNRAKKKKRRNYDFVDQRLNFSFLCVKKLLGNSGLISLHHFLGYQTDQRNRSSTLLHHFQGKRRKQRKRTAVKSHIKAQ